MGNFEKARADMIKKKNDVYVKKEELKERISEFDKRRQDVEDGISRIPDDLPQELQQQVDVAIENTRAKLDTEAEEIGQEADEAKEEADEAMDMADEIEADLLQKAEKMSALKDVPLIGSFADTKANDLMGQAEQMVDLRQETSGYREELALERNKLYANR